jgi:uncharacterized protein YbjT (DUF2867 family)
MTRRVAVAGATGFVGRALVARLADDGHSVVALARSITAADVPDGVTACAVDLDDGDALAGALVGVDACFYLVHSMASSEGFADQDRRLAEQFGEVAADQGVDRIVYLGALGEDPSSTHLSSRQEVGRLLGAAGVSVVELRAAVILGAGSISFEMLRYLAERLPYMVCPVWVQTRIQPLARSDLLEYLRQAMDVAPGIYEIGGADVTTYREMLRSYAAVRGLHPRHILDIPLLTPRLSAYWVDLVTPVNRTVSHALIESLVTEVVVTRPEVTSAAFDVEPLGLTDALRQALDEQRAEVPGRLFTLEDGPDDGLYAMQVREPVPVDDHERVGRELAGAGGDLSWYGVPRLWRLRLLAGRLWGEQAALIRPASLVPGSTVDWWTVVRAADDELVLETSSWKVGEAWLGYRIDAAGQRLWMAGALRPKGILGFLYWKLLEPIHRRVFVAMARRRLRQPEVGAAATAGAIRVSGGPRR